MLPRICMKKPDVLENDDDRRAWFTELKRHHMGEFSMAAYQANSIMEDYSQVEVGDNGLFVGIYNGQNGTSAAKFVSDHIFQELSRLIRENYNVMHGKLLSEAVAATEQKFTDFVNDNKDTNPDLMHTGSCCLIALIRNQAIYIYIANLGDSQAVLGTNDILGRKFLAEPLIGGARIRVASPQQLFPHDTILLNSGNGWKVKDLSKVTGTIGDVHLKTHLPVDDLFSPPYYRSVLTSKPTMNSRIITHGAELFFILASCGFWEIMTNEEAVSIVKRRSRRGIAKILLRKALEKVAAKEKMSYKDIVHCADRKRFHDDITIIVVFIDQYRPLWKRNAPKKLSCKAPSHA